MLLRRVIQNIEDQNWTAVALDFVIVVVGVFIGVQMANWNDARGERRDYKDALERYRVELTTNLATLDTADKEIAFMLQRVSPAIDALLTCEDSPENRAVIETGLRGILGTYGLKLRERSLKDLTETPHLLAQQSARERAAFGETRYLMDVFLREAGFVELMPLEERMQNNPIIKIGPPINRESVYVGQDYSRPERQLILAVPVDEACQNNELIKSFYTWERWQGVLPAISRLLREQIEADLVLLDEIAPVKD